MESNWPDALDDSIICRTQQDKECRARIIIELLIDEDITEKKIIDFGCGEGFAAAYASTLANLSVGYDVVEQNWKIHNSKSLIFTQNFIEVLNYAPFDVILLFDVLNHAQDPDELLKQIYLISNFKSKIYLRTHPWTSRHATHDIENKAYAHLLPDAKINGVFHNKIEANSLFFKQFGFKVVKKRVAMEEVESFFLQIGFVDKPNSIQFIDYVLQKEIVRFL